MNSRLIWKEVREIAFLGLLTFVACCWLAIHNAGYTFDWSGGQRWILTDWVSGTGEPVIPFLHGLNGLLTLLCLFAATAIGLWQSLSETIRGTWPYLLHRPLPRRRLFAVKLAVGIGLLLTAIGVPLFLLAWWAATPGTHASPFEWQMTGHSWRLCFGAVVVYLGAFHAGIRDARWYGSRLFPIVGAMAVLFFIYLTGWWPWTCWIVGCTAIVIYLAAIDREIAERDFG